MYFIRKLREFGIDKTICTLFYRSVLESVVLFCIAAWAGNANKRDIIRINRLIKIASKCTNAVAAVETLHANCSLMQLNKVLKDKNHPLYRRISLSNRSNRILSQTTRTERHLRSFLPYSIRLYNSH